MQKKEGSSFAPSPFCTKDRPWTTPVRGRPKTLLIVTNELSPQATLATIGTTKKVRHLASIWGDREAEITCIFCYVCVIVGLCRVAR
jgi:hypothetical protein